MQKMKAGINQEDYGISLARTVGVILIISCHVLQFYGNELAWWLNCGVQLFLGLSGFIYGQRKIDDDFGFIKKRFVRILKDYYIYWNFVNYIFIICSRISSIRRHYEFIIL